MYYPYGLFDPTYILIIIGAVITMIASSKMNSTFRRYSRVRCHCGLTGSQCGHAVQHQKGYVPLTIRGALVPIVNIGSNLSWVFIIAGIFLSMNQTLLHIGIALFSLAVIFQLVTLPVEFNASARALRILGSTGIMYGEEVDQTKKVLKAAALTYVAGAAAALLSLLRLIILFGGNDRDR